MARDIREHRDDRLRGEGSVMGDLIAFRSQRPSGQARPSGAGAEILFFTGVRYQRMSDEAPPASAKPRKPRVQGGPQGRRRRRADSPA